MGKKGSSSAVRIDSKDIKSLAKRNNIKQKDLARLIGYTPEGFSRSLRLGRFERFEDVEKIAEVLNVDPFSIIVSNSDSEDKTRIHYDYASYYNRKEGLTSNTNICINGKLLKKIISLQNRSVGDISDYLEVKPEYIIDIIDNNKSIDLTSLIFLSFYLDINPKILLEQNTTHHLNKPELLDDKDLADYLKQNEFSFGSGFNYSVPFINLFFGDDSRLEFADLTSKRTIMRLIYDFKETLIYYFLQFIKDHPDKFTTDELKQYLLDNLINIFSALENGSSGNK